MSEQNNTLPSLFELVQRIGGNLETAHERLVGELGDLKERNVTDERLQVQVINLGVIGAAIHIAQAIEDALDGGEDEPTLQEAAAGIVGALAGNEGAKP